MICMYYIQINAQNIYIILKLTLNYSNNKQKCGFKRAVAFFMDTTIVSIVGFPTRHSYWINNHSRHRQVQFPHL